MSPINSISVPPYGYGEISPFDDLKDLDGKGFSGFSNKTESRDTEEITKWAKDTDELATQSIISYLIEFPLKIVTYFVSHSDFKNTLWDKVFSSLEDITGTFGDMFRNQIYSHKDSKGEYDDNLGAELTASHTNKDESSQTLSGINNLVQTKGKFLVAAISLISPSLANDLEWAVVRAMDGCWWRNMSSNIAYGPGFGKNLFHQLFGSLFEKLPTQNSNENIGQTTEKITFGSIFNRFKENFQNVNTSWNNYKNTSSENTEETNISKLNFYRNTDKAISSFIPIVNWLNIAGDVLRPLFRRFNVDGIPRNIVRLLSAIDRPFFWFTNFFRYYLPEKLTQNTESKKHGITDVMDSPNLLLASIAGDVIDFGTLMFEDSIKESSGMINHLIEVTRRVTQSASDIYFSARRKQAARNLIVNEKI